MVIDYEDKHDSYIYLLDFKTCDIKILAFEKNCKAFTDSEKECIVAKYWQTKYITITRKRTQKTMKKDLQRETVY